MPTDVKHDPVWVDLGDRSYPIEIGPGLLDEAGQRCRAMGLGSRLLVVADEHVGRLYGGVVLKSLKEAGFSVDFATFPAGEAYKSLETAAALYGACLDAGLDRGSGIVALGGGVVGDVAGFVAATYMRGIDLVQLPTTLLSQVDSSVGGKTGVNHPRGKNLIGAFHQPRLVLADVSVLVSLDPREYRSGLAEVVKAGLIRDPDLVELLEKEWLPLLRLDGKLLTRVVRRAVQIKAEVVQADEREAGLRAILNFGHTVGHALEAATGYRRFTHGEAISIGMVVEAELSAALGLIGPGDVSRIREMLARFGLPVDAQGVPYEKVQEAMRLDKKVKDGRLRFALLDGIGSCRIVSDVSEEAVAAAYRKHGGG
ncbi:MAG TPA: 3-dehydroquinate synthase [Limnochordia bacterium]|nr:3-dehydroquinate synthase [Limnochordia bacterium]